MQTFDAKAYRGALGQFATGVTIVTARGPDGAAVGVTANSFNSVSLDPPLVLWSLAHTSRSMPVFREAEHFAVHILARDQQQLSDRFASSVTDKFAGLDVTGDRSPLLAGCTARFECTTRHRYEGGDHLIFVGEVIAYESGDKPPLLYHSGGYAEARRQDQDQEEALLVALMTMLDDQPQAFAGRIDAGERATLRAIIGKLVAG